MQVALHRNGYAGMQRYAAFLWSVVKHLTSNAVAIGRGRQLLGAGAGQMDRVTAEGESRWTLNSSLGYAFGFHTLARSLYAALPEPP